MDDELDFTEESGLATVVVVVVVVVSVVVLTMPPMPSKLVMVNWRLVLKTMVSVKIDGITNVTVVYPVGPTVVTTVLGARVIVVGAPVTVDVAVMVVAGF